MIIDQLPLLGGDVQGTDEFPIERGTTTYKTTQAALIKDAIEKGLPSGGTAGQVLKKADSADYSVSWEDPSVTADMIGIVQNSDAATQNIAKGQYVIWHGALYTASADIASGAALSGSNLTAINGGGLNDLRNSTFALSNKTFSDFNDIANIGLYPFAGEALANSPGTSSTMWGFLLVSPYGTGYISQVFFEFTGTGGKIYLRRRNPSNSWGSWGTLA